MKIKRYPLMGFPERLKESIQTSRFSQKSLAERLGVDRKTVGTWCNGEYSPDVVVFGKLCKLLHVSADYLLYGKKSYQKTA